MKQAFSDNYAFAFTSKVRKSTLRLISFSCPGMYRIEYPYKLYITKMTRKILSEEETATFTFSKESKIRTPSLRNSFNNAEKDKS